MVDIKCQNLIFSNIQAIIFDKDGTLEDSKEYLRQVGQRVAKIVDMQFSGLEQPLLMAFGINGDSLDPAGLIAVGSSAETAIATAAYIAQTGCRWIESLAIARQAFKSAEKHVGNIPSPMFVGSLEVLKNLTKAGIKLGILSAARTDEVYAFVKHHQLSDYIQVQIGVDEGPSKPDPILFLQACQSLEVEPGSTLMVGDSMGDMQMALNAKAAGCIGISWIRQFENLIGADVLINHLNEIEVVTQQHTLILSKQKIS
ncbi:HAD family hydrolase [Fischerella sp. JS2]|uniref:HAD family hydrolase n=1 Tax=Fischerella sp. JS2 TaxID=2597771 RepID=UPI0028EB8F6B|nr:HAD family hydrolase [Fischerella sp. JS2]